MKYCKKCGVLYSSLLEQCPKCNTALSEHEAEAQAPAPEASRQTKVRQWIALIIGVPALIFFLYFVIEKHYSLT